MKLLGPVNCLFPVVLHGTISIWVISFIQTISFEKKFYIGGYIWLNHISLIRKRIQRFEHSVIYVKKNDFKMLSMFRGIFRPCQTSMMKLVGSHYLLSQRAPPWMLQQSQIRLGNFFSRIVNIFQPLTTFTKIPQVFGP